MNQNGEGLSQPAPQRVREPPKRPGGPYRPKPIEINGVYYYPFAPPKLFQAPDDKQKYSGGKVIDRD